MKTPHQIALSLRLGPRCLDIGAQMQPIVKFVIFRPVRPTHCVPRPGAKVMHVISEGVGIKYL
jgi:hypothetical protein